MRITLSSTDECLIQKLIIELGQLYPLTHNTEYAITADCKKMEFELDESNPNHSALIHQIYLKTNNQSIAIFPKDYPLKNIPEPTQFTLQDIKSNTDLKAIFTNYFKYIITTSQLPMGVTNSPIGSQISLAKSFWLKETQALDQVMGEVKAIFKQINPDIENFNVIELMAWLKSIGLKDSAALSELDKHYGRVEQLNIELDKFCTSNAVFSNYITSLSNYSSQTALSSPATVLQILSQIPPLPNQEKKFSLQPTPEKFGLKAIDKYESCQAHLFHGIGVDLTKITLIGRDGILTAEEGEKHHPDYFKQSHGVTQVTNTGGVNGKKRISLPNFDTPCYQQYNKPSISFMISRIGLDLPIFDRPPRAIDGESHVEGNIPSEKIKYLCLPAELLKQEAGTGIGYDIVNGSSATPFKCEGFIHRVQELFDYSDNKSINTILDLAKSYDILFSISPSPQERGDHQSHINQVKQELALKLDIYFKTALQNAYPEIKTIKDYIDNKQLNKFQPVVIRPAAYNKPQTIDNQTNTVTPNFNFKI